MFLIWHKSHVCILMSEHTESARNGKAHVVEHPGVYPPQWPFFLHNNAVSVSPLKSSYFSTHKKPLSLQLRARLPALGPGLLVQP